MAISTPIFNTPTGQVYDPSEKIDRSFQRLGSQITTAMNNESERLRLQEEQFGQIYNNLGEIEGQLQQNYAGIQQQMVDATRDYVKGHLKKGGRATDPEFQMEMGQRTGRIKAGVANADRNRQQLKEAAELIKNDPAIVDKYTAMASLMSQYNDPDFLISQNSFDAGQYLDQFVSPQKVFETVWKNIPSSGEFADQYTDERGNLRERSIIYNDLIDRDNPVNPDGTPNIRVAPEFMKNVREGAFGQRIVDQTLRIANQRYSDLPTDVAFTRALRDGLQTASGVNFKDTIKRSAYDIQRDEALQARQNRSLDRQDRMLDLQYERLRRQGASEEKAQREAQEYSNLYQEFVNSAETGDKAHLGRYEIPGGNVKGIDWLTEKDIVEKDLGSYDSWKNMSRNERIALLQEHVPEDQIPTGALGRYDTEPKNAYDLVVDAMKSKASDRPVGIKYQEKGATKDGKVNWNPVAVDWSDDPSKIPNVFEQLQNLRKKVKGSTNPANPTPETNDPKDLTSIWR